MSLSQLFSSDGWSSGTKTAEHKAHMKYRPARPLTAHRHPNSSNQACVSCVTARTPIAGDDCTIPTANERHLMKYWRTTKLHELYEVICPQPDMNPYVRYINQSLEDKDAKRKPDIPARLPSAEVNL